MPGAKKCKNGKAIGSEWNQGGPAARRDRVVDEGRGAADCETSSYCTVLLSRRSNAGLAANTMVEHSTFWRRGMVILQPSVATVGCFSPKGSHIGEGRYEKSQATVDTHVAHLSRSTPM